MYDEINAILEELEDDHGCRVRYAVESGSRAWGFASPDSDYDVRFLYAYPTGWYLDLRERPDTLEHFYPGDLDCAGWELRKALRLFAGCNLSLCEWIASPIVYRAEGALTDELCALAPVYFKPRKAIHHYLGTARGIRQNHLAGDAITIKRLFYIVRPLAAATWVARRGTMPPVPLIELMDADLLPDDVAREVCEFLAAKKSAAEGEVVRVSSGLLAWMDTAFAALQEATGELEPEGPCDWAPLNALFLRTLEELA